jgi:ribosome-binding protein aMBF1 (putative translation factor)
MALTRAEHRTTVKPVADQSENHAAPTAEPDVPPERVEAPTLEQVVRARHDAGDSQRAIARELNIDRRKVKRIIEQPA